MTSIRCKCKGEAFSVRAKHSENKLGKKPIIYRPNASPLRLLLFDSFFYDVKAKSYSFWFRNLAVAKCGNSSCDRCGYISY
ncbi:hypothetical protein FJR38_18935 [Anabaena sp. UHCC 0253]|nr:hypothetical protein [Anabaena sp. UHCC 0253]